MKCDNGEYVDPHVEGAEPLAVTAARRMCPILGTGQLAVFQTPGFGGPGFCETDAKAA